CMVSSQLKPIEPRANRAAPELTPRTNYEVRPAQALELREKDARRRIVGAHGPLLYRGRELDAAARRGLLFVVGPGRHRAPRDGIRSDSVAFVEHSPHYPRVEGNARWRPDEVVGHPHDGELGSRSAGQSEDSLHIVAQAGDENSVQ